MSGGILGSANNGTYTVLSANTNSLVVNGSFQSAVTASPGPFYNNVQGFDASVSDFYREVQTTCLQEPGIPGYGSIILKQSIPQLVGKISQQNGFVATAQNKLNFSEDVIFGINGYSTFAGLIKAATLEVFGDETEPDLFPGLISPGSYLEILPPIIKRVIVSLSVRLVTGLTLNDVESNIQNAIVGLINVLKIGQSLPLSDIITTVNTINGVQSVVITFPTYSSTSDSITVTSKEKLLVLSNNDISVSLLDG